LRTLLRLICVLLGAGLVFSYLLGVMDPQLGASDQPPETRAQMVLRGLPVFIYGLALFVPPRLTRKLVFFVPLLLVRSAGLAAGLLLTYALFRDQATSWGAVAVLLLFPVGIYVRPGTLAVLEVPLERTPGKSGATGPGAENA